MENKDDKLLFRGGVGMAFLPMIIFCAGVVGVFVIWMALDFNAVAFMAIIGLIVGSLFTKNFKRYWQAAAHGMANEICIYTLLILFVVGMFGALIKACNVSNGFVWLAYKINLSGGGFAVFVFIATCVVSTATGSSFSALYSCFPIFYPAAVILGCKPSIIAGMILAGAIFGDNLAPISDTTILSASCQEYKSHPGKVADIGGCVATRFKYCLVAGIISCVLYGLIAGGGNAGEGASEYLLSVMDPKPLVMLVPVAAMLFISIKTHDIFKAIITGIVLGTIVGLIFGLIEPAAIFTVNEGVVGGFLVSGFNGMVGVVLIILCLNGVMGVMKDAGALDALANKILKSKLAATTRGTEIALGLLCTIVCTIMGGAQDPAIITMSPIVDKVGREKGIHPYRRANLLDGFSNSLAVSVPFLSCYVFLTAQLSEGYEFVGALNAFQVSTGMIYTILLWIVLLISTITGWGRIYEGPNGEMVTEKGKVVKHPYSILMK